MRSPNTKKAKGNPYNLLKDLYEIVGNETTIKKEFKRAQYTFWGFDYPYYINKTNKNELDVANGRFLEWFLFDIRLIKFDKKTPAQWYIDQYKDEVGDKKYNLYQEVIKSQFVVLKLENCISPKEYKVIDLKKRSRFKIITHKVEKQFKYGRCIVGRIFFWSGDYILSDFFDLLPDSSLFETSKNKDAFFNALDALKWERFHKI